MENKIEHKEIIMKGYITQAYNYKGYKISRPHSSRPFDIVKSDGTILYFRTFTNKCKWNKITLKKIMELIDSDNLDEFYSVNTND